MILVKFLKITKYLFLLIVLFIFFELTSCNNHYINKTSVSLDINNINNPQVKKLMRAVDGYLGNIYFNFSKAKQKEFFDKRQDEYEKLPSPSCKLHSELSHFPPIKVPSHQFNLISSKVN